MWQTLEPYFDTVNAIGLIACVIRANSNGNTVEVRQLTKTVTHILKCVIIKEIFQLDYILDDIVYPENCLET